MDTATGPELDAIKARWTQRRGSGLGFDPVDAIRLLGAVEAVLELADRWTLRPGDADWARTRAMDECAAKVREAITAALVPVESGGDKKEDRDGG